MGEDHDLYHGLYAAIPAGWIFKEFAAPKPGDFFVGFKNGAGDGAKPIVRTAQSSKFTTMAAIVQRPPLPKDTFKRGTDEYSLVSTDPDKGFAVPTLNNCHAYVSMNRYDNNVYYDGIAINLNANAQTFGGRRWLLWKKPPQPRYVVEEAKAVEHLPWIVYDWSLAKTTIARFAVQTDAVAYAGMLNQRLVDSRSAFVPFG